MQMTGSFFPLTCLVCVCVCFWVATAGVFCPLSANTKETEGPWWKAALQLSFCQRNGWLMFKLPVDIRYDGSSSIKVIFRSKPRQERRASDVWGAPAEFQASLCGALHRLTSPINWINVHHSQSLEMLWHFVYYTWVKYVCLSNSFDYLSLIAMMRSLRLCLLFQERRTAGHVYFLRELFIRLKCFCSGSVPVWH